MKDDARKLRTADDGLLKVASVAEWLDTGLSNVYSMIREARLPAIRFGHELRVRVKDLREWIAQQHVIGDLPPVTRRGRGWR